MPATDPPGSPTSGAPAVESSSSPPATVDTTAPLPTDVQPFPVACPCLNVVIAGYASNEVVSQFNDGKEASFGECVQVYLPEKAEAIRHMPMSTFEHIEHKADAWRKCWVCGSRVYSVKGKAASDKLAPINAWVEVDLSNGVIYGDKIDETKQRVPLAYSGLVLDLPATSSFGREPQPTEPVPYPAQPPSTTRLLPAIPDPFFLPPPFIPNHPALREMCKAAVVALQERHNEIERDIRDYISQRAQDMKRLEDQVRAEVEALWDRYVQGPLGGQDVDRRGSVSIRASIPAPGTRVTSGTDAVPTRTKSLEKIDKAFERDREVDGLPSGVVPDPPSIGSQFNAHTASASASLLSASLATNVFHAPPPRRAAQNIDDIEALAKNASRDGAVSREVAMSFAFSAMEEHAGAASRRRNTPAQEQKQDFKETEAVEEEGEEREKGIDSWIAMERSQATNALAEEVADPIAPVKAEPSDDVASNVDKKGRVHFQEPDKSAKDKEPKVEQEDTPDDEDEDDDDDYVFDMDTDDPGPPRASVEPPPVKAPERGQVRTMVEDNLSRTFAAEAPSHRAAWRAVEERGLTSVLRRSPRHDDDDDDDEVDESPADAFARSVPITITKPVRAIAPQLERKTSLTDRNGMLVPGLIGAMRERGLDRSAPRPIVGSLAKATPVRRGSRSASGEREREQVKSYAADPGAVFESLAESAVSDDDDEDDDKLPLPTNGKFVPPHVLAQRAADKDKGIARESGWGSLAS